MANLQHITIPQNGSLNRHCYTCGREERGIGKVVMDDFITKGHRKYCSISCRDLDMDWTTREKEAMRAGAKMFGEYIESEGKAEIFSGLTAEQFMIALECYTKEYHRFLAAGKTLNDEIPF